MSDAPFAREFQKTFKSYISTPASQINLGYTLTSFWYTAAFYLGLFLIAVALVIIGLNSDFRNNTKSKKPLIVLAMIGLGMLLFSLYGTVTTFYTTVTRINKSVKLDKECSLFLPDTPSALFKKLASEATEDEIIGTRLAANVMTINRAVGQDGPTSTEQDIGD